MRIAPEQARARLQPQGKKKAKGELQLQFIGSIGHAEEDIYLFDGEDGGVAAPADDSLPPILGVWEEGGQIPPAMKDWLQEYAYEVEWWQRVGGETSKPARARAQAVQRHSVPMMVETKWAQGSPYNDTLIFDGDKCKTGCPATAVAQVMQEWGRRGYHRGCLPTKDYKTKTNGYLVSALPSLMVFDYDNLVPVPKTTKEKEAVQQLMTYLGRAFQSDYKPNSTSASVANVTAALRDKLRMGDVKRIYASTLGAAGFEQKVYEEVAALRPLIMSGYNDEGGHCFVVDGYDASTGMYHVNWGWGKYNGWFLLSALNPYSSVTYNSRKSAMVNIDPGYMLGDVNGDGEVNITDAMQVMQDAQGGKYDPQADINSDGQVTISDAQLIIDKILGRIEL